MGRPNDINKLTQALYGSPTYLGRITSAGTAKDNTTTVAPFAIPKGSVIMMVGSAAFDMKPGLVSSGAVTAVTGVPVASGAEKVMALLPNEAYAQVIVTGDVDFWGLL